MNLNSSQANGFTTTVARIVRIVVWTPRMRMKTTTKDNAKKPRKKSTPKPKQAANPTDEAKGIMDDDMTNEIRGGMDTEKVRASVGNGRASKTITLNFDNDLELYDKIVQAADNDDRPVGKYLLRQIRALDLDVQ